MKEEIVFDDVEKRSLPSLRRSFIDRLNVIVRALALSLERERERRNEIGMARHALSRDIRCADDQETHPTFLEHPVKLGSALTYTGIERVPRNSVDDAENVRSYAGASCVYTVKR